MKRVLVSAVALLGATGFASAADVALKVPVRTPIVAPAFSWTGCYIGAHAGVGSLNDTYTSEDVPTRNGVGGVAGGQVGCNYQIGQLVVGVEGEGYWSGITNTLRNTDTFGFTEQLRSKNKYDYDVAARVGLAFDRALIYGKLGWVWGKFDFSYSNSDGGYTNGSKTLNGALIGLGTEYAFAPNWTAKIEYNYLKFGTAAVPFAGYDSNDEVFFTESRGHGADKHVVKIGLNYLLTTSAPVVAKY